VLSLASATGADWLERAVADLDEILIDHAHCEKKAVSSALGLIFKYPERTALATALSRLAREELVHFEQVVGALASRGLVLRHQVPSPYAASLFAAVRHEEPARLVDTLLCMAFIEARSCERLGLLAAAFDGEPLGALYRPLVASEARHLQAYLDLAAEVVPHADLRGRVAELAAHEAAVLASAPPMPRLHA
jgi:tRNA 2-(methylsulfanyl)-N6-isopentenyladenosine37 hydroxylase